MTRYDELAAQNQIDRARSQDKMLKTGANVVGGAISSVGIGGLAAKVAPFLSQYIPADLALKGIAKVAPNLGKILQKGMDEGLDLKEGLSFLRDKFSKEEMQQPEEEEKNIIKKYAPHLDKFIQQSLASGKDPGETANAAWKKDEKIVKKLEKDTNKSWLELVEETYGTGAKKVQNQQATPVQNAGGGKNWDEIAKRLKEVLAS